MWIDWDNPNHVDILKPDTRQTKPKVLVSRPNTAHNRELIDENKRLWIELKEKNDFIISLQDDIYYKQQELQKLEKCKQDSEKINSDQHHVALIKEISKLKTELHEKTSMINMLNNMVESLCDDVLQNEHIEHIEEEISRLRLENEKLSKENSDIKVKLKIVEHDNDKLHTRTQHFDDENHALKKKLDKTSRKLKERENSLLNFKNFHELVNNLQSRISRSKNENLTLKNALQRMANLANNYDKLEKENAELKKSFHEADAKSETLKNTVLELQHKQIQIKEDEMVTKPALIRENQNLREQLNSTEQKLHDLTDISLKLKTNLKIYEKMLMESKEFVEQKEKQGGQMKKIIDENQAMKDLIQNLNQNLTHENANKTILLKEKEYLQQERDKMSQLLQHNELEKENLIKELALMKRSCEEADIEIDDLKRQLQLCKNTIHNQDTTLKIRTAELHNLSKENKELRLNVKQYESQIQMDGKVYKLVRWLIIEMTRLMAKNFFFWKLKFCVNYFIKVNSR